MFEEWTLGFPSYVAASVRGRPFAKYITSIKRADDVKAADDIDAHVGSRVRLRRMTLNISQEQLGEALGLTFQQIQKYEKGQNRIGAGRLYKISQILSVPVEFFYEGLPVAGNSASEDKMAARNVEIQQFLASPDGHALSRAFLKIADSATRRRIVDLVNTIAQEH